MPRFAANLSLMYTEHPFLDRFEAAARDGFEAVEFQFPYAWPAAEIAARLRGNGLQLVLLNAPPGGSNGPTAMDAAARGERGLACQPGRESEMRDGVRLALDYAQALGCPRFHLMAGSVPEGVEHGTAHGTFLANLGWASAQAAKAGIDVLIEPLNPHDAPGYFLGRQAQAHAIVAAVGAPNLKVQFDVYHCQVAEGDVASKIRQYLPGGRVGHLQVAGPPGRHEPDVGEVNFPYLFQVIDEVAPATGWSGWIGCEYKPLRGGQPGGTSAGLGWLRGLR